MTREPQPIVVNHDGLRHFVLDWGGRGETVVMLHPNGLCAGFFDPLARRLTDTYHVIGVDLRGHGGSEPPPDRAGLGFAAMASDVVAILDELGVLEFCVVGESLGGGIGVVLDHLRPGGMRKLVLCEAIAFDSATFAEGLGRDDGGNANGMADMTRARRAVWPDRDMVRSRYASRPPFDVVSEEALDAYLRWGFFDRADGQVELACTPDIEAAVYEVSASPIGAPVAFAHLPALHGRAVVVHGDATYLPDAWFRAQADAANAPIVVVPGGHFFLQEDTDRAEAVVREVLRG